MENIDLGTGLGGIALTVLILREVFSFVKSTKVPNGSAPVSILNLSNGGDGIVDAALIALGPYLAPGRIVVPKSNGSPIMATSGFVSTIHARASS